MTSTQTAKKKEKLLKYDIILLGFSPSEVIKKCASDAQESKDETAWKKKCSLMGENTERFCPSKNSIRSTHIFKKGRILKSV